MEQERRAAVAAREAARAQARALAQQREAARQQQASQLRDKVNARLKQAAERRWVVWSPGHFPSYNCEGVEKPQASRVLVAAMCLAECC